MKCLVVEDQEMVRELMVIHLMDYCEVDTAADGVEGVALFSRALEEQRPYQLVCLDIQMPNMDGQEALKQMRRLEMEDSNSQGKAVIIMTTASNEVTDIEEALWQGDCTDYLVKPVNPEDLLALLKKNKIVECV